MTAEDHWSKENSTTSEETVMLPEERALSDRTCVIGAGTHIPWSKANKDWHQSQPNHFPGVGLLWIELYTPQGCFEA